MNTAILEALATGVLPAESDRWHHGDDLCDCSIQRIVQHTNPYLAETSEVRLCCLFSDLKKMFPQHFRDIPAGWDINAQAWDTQPWEWNGEVEMPSYLHHRQLAKVTGVSVAEARAMDTLPPQGKSRTPVVFWLPMGNEYLETVLG